MTFPIAWVEFVLEYFLKLSIVFFFSKHTIGIIVQKVKIRSEKPLPISSPTAILYTKIICC